MFSRYYKTFSNNNIKVECLSHLSLFLLMLNSRFRDSWIDALH